MKFEIGEFEIGEIVIGQNFINYPEHNGTEIEILGNLEMTTLITTYDGKIFREMAYKCRMANGDIRWQPPKYLRKKKPPEELGSWEAIQSLTHWNPSKIEVSQ